MFSKKKSVFIPLEISSRELDYKMILASLLAEQNVHCFVGQHNLLNKLLKYVRGGVYFGKNVFPERFPCNMDYFHTLKAQNFSLAYYHEEGGVLAGEKDDWNEELKRQLNPNCLDNDDAILCWGEYQKNFYQSLASNKPLSIHKVGCPRFDLQQGSEMYSLLDKTSRVKESSYILFNTNFAAVNHHIDNLTWFKNTNRKDINIHQNANTISIYSQTMQVMGNFLEMIAAVLSEFPQKQFYLRPHPSEDMDFYKSIFNGFNNLKIIREYTSIEWIKQCDLLIQNGCTTSLEAHFMDKKIISYYPLPNKNNVNITRNIGKNVRDTSEIIEIIKAPEKYSFESNDLENISKLIDNFSVPKKSFSKITSILNKMLSNKTEASFNIFKIMLRTFAHTSLIKFKESGQFFSSTKKKNIRYFNSNFPGFNKNELEQKIMIIEEILNKKIFLQYINKDLFIISKKNEH